jgi:aminoglycoside phosphotransferase (APT) family kinase protein
MLFRTVSPVKVHPDEVDVDLQLVRRLIDSQFPEWKYLPLAPVGSAGTDNWMFRLGADLVVRIPRIMDSALRIEKEHRWLPILGPAMPLPIPVPVGLGQPAFGYPWAWSVLEWLGGGDLNAEPVDDKLRLARDLIDFINALHAVDICGAPRPGRHNARRGVDLVDRDSSTRAGIAALSDVIDAAAARSVWTEALTASVWDRDPVWIHGDLQPGNLLGRGGRLAAVIDFGNAAIGDPACDAMVAWTLFDSPVREQFRRELGADDALWARARGWALSVGVIALPYYEETNRALATVAKRGIDEAIGDIL